MTREFIRGAVYSGDLIEASDIESHNTLGVGEKYPLPFLSVYHAVQKSDRNIKGPKALQLAIKALKDTMGPQGLVPSPLSFGQLARFIAPRGSPGQRQRLAAISAAREEDDGIACESGVNTALCGKLPPVAKHLLSPGDRVCIYRDHSQR